jgi:hypothetical protein
MVVLVMVVQVLLVRLIPEVVAVAVQEAVVAVHRVVLASLLLN